MQEKTVIDFKELGHRYVFEKPLAVLKTRQLAEVERIIQQVSDYQKQGYYVVGYLSYEASPAFEAKFEVKSQALSGEYLAYFTVHEQAQTEEFPLTYAPVDLPEQWENLSTQEEYENAIASIHHEIRQGNTYQVNHTTRLKAEVSVNPYAIYNRLMVEQGAGYNAYIVHDDVAILSASPELFFKVEGDKLTTRPMKGTTARGLTLADDVEQRDWLARDTKNRAENMMIVDLLRNDMGRLCDVGSVKVAKLCDVEQYSTVWQMTSTIEGRLQEKSLLDIFRALFPCGSITGAPKISTMSVINRLENSPRGIYCGAIGICLPDGRAIFNVPIRTMQVQGQIAYYGVGGGITWDSRWQDEYKETQQKAAVLHRQQPQFDILTTGLVSNKQLTMFDQHLTRLREACQYYNFPFREEDLASSLTTFLSNLGQGDYRLRIRIAKSGAFHFDDEALAPLPESYRQARLVERKLPETSFVYFKTSHREHIPASQQEQIFHSPDGVLQETSIANLILDIDGEWLTPPVADGCLPGLYRQKLLREGKVKEQSLTVADLDRASKILACNAVRGLYELEITQQLIGNINNNETYRL